MGVAESIKRLTEAEYLELERAAELKSEFFEGEMYARSGGTPRHSLIFTEIFARVDFSPVQIRPQVRPPL